jgi:ribosomal protein S18 acetylase RimI-like enzyme
MSILISVRPVESSSDVDCDNVATAIDVAFLEGDSWFKKEGCKHRCPNGGKDIKDLLCDKHGTFGTTFLLAQEGEDSSKVLGAVRVDWNASGLGHFGMLGVPAANAGRGVGKALVAAAVQYLTEKNQTKLEMPVVATKNERLVQWYEKQQFQCIGELFPFPVPDIVLEEFQGTIMMTKMSRALTCMHS